METQPDSPRADAERDDDSNSLDYRKVDEEAEHDEQGTQGSDPQNVPPSEE